MIAFILILVIVVNENDYQYHYVAWNTTKKCIGARVISVYAGLHTLMTKNKTSILLSDVSIEGDLIEKDSIIFDGKINGNIKADVIETYTNSNIKGNIKANTASLGGKLKGNVNSDQINIKKTADIDGVLNQKTLSIEEGATLKIKTETYK